MNDVRGQASVEVIGFLPLVLVVALAAFTVIASHTAHEQAGEAAEAGALVLLQGGPSPRDAGEAALPGRPRRRATITINGNRITVRVRPRPVLPIPGLADRLS